MPQKFQNLKKIDTSYKCKKESIENHSVVCHEVNLDGAAKIYVARKYWFLWWLYGLFCDSDQWIPGSENVHHTKCIIV